MTAVTHAIVHPSSTLGQYHYSLLAMVLSITLTSYIPQYLARYVGEIRAAARQGVRNISLVAVERRGELDPEPIATGAYLSLELIAFLPLLDIPPLRSRRSPRSTGFRFSVASHVCQQGDNPLCIRGDSQS